jgi:chitinase
VGSVFTGYESADGQNWTVVASDTFTMASTVYVGIAVTSHNSSVSTHAVADTLTVKAASTNQPPSVSLTSPANGATYTAPASIPITASASDPQNQLTKVEFYNGPTLLGSAAAAPYSYTWGSVGAGTYSLTAMAYDAAGLKTQSAAVSLTVSSPTSPPTGVSFTASADDATVTDYRIDVFAQGADPNTATPVATFDAGKPTPGANNTDTVSAPSFFSALAAGTYQLTVSAISANGVGRSAAITFTR